MSPPHDTASRDPSIHDAADDTIAPLPRVSVQAFCETPDVAAAIQAAASDRRMIKATVKVQHGGGAAAAEAYRDAATPNVIVLESVGDRGALIRHLDELSQACDPGTRVVVIGHVNDVVLYRELIRRGVSDYLIAPVSLVDVVRCLSGLYASADAPPVGRTIAFVGSKGGVGASTVAHNVAFALSRALGVATTLVDLDLPFGTAGLDFNQDPPQGVAEAVYAPERLDPNMLDRLTSRCTDTLSLLAAPATLERTYDVAEGGFDPVVDLLRATTPAIVLDVPHGWGAWHRRVLLSADEIVLVVAPDLANLRNAKNLCDTLKGLRPNDRAPRLVVNGAGLPKRPEIAAAEFAKALELPPAAVIAHDAALFGSAANNGQMIGEVQAKGKVTEAFEDLARLLLGRAEARGGAKRSALAPLAPLLARLGRRSA